MVKTILIAANDPNIIYLLRRYAEASGFQVVRCEFGEELLNLAREIIPALILFEIEPTGAGWQPYLQHLKADPLTSAIPVMAYSYLDEVDCNHVAEIDGYLHKSVMYHDFITALDKAGIQPVD
jgi:CheY-like chemotaxis protein